MRISCILIYIASVVVIFSLSASAKIRETGAFYPTGISQKNGKTAAVNAALGDFESRMRPFLEYRSARGNAVRAKPPEILPRESDFLRIAGLWPGLSPEFKTLYKSVTALPAAYTSYISPGGHFQVFYTTDKKVDSASAVDTTDSYGYGLGPDWRVKKTGGNGIPDYVDEVAWACDSSWTMLVDSFKFRPPVTLGAGGLPSPYYRVRITEMDRNYYGMTWPLDPAPAGYSSYLEIRNEWKTGNWGPPHYELYPVNGIRVTCAHELFHGVQYAMTRHVKGIVYLDDFPISWIEGTAVLMEETGFDSINDYVQYAAMYFDNPNLSFLDSVDNMFKYSNSLLAKYIYRYVNPPDPINPVRTVFFDNFNYTVPGRTLDFFTNIRTASLKNGAAWHRVLNNFFTGSYFTGTRADTSRFFPDSKLFGSWDPLVDILDSAQSVRKEVRYQSFQTFVCLPQQADSGTILIEIQCDTRTTDTIPVWAGSYILCAGNQKDSVASFDIRPKGDTLRISNWKMYNRIIVIISNALPRETRSATVSFGGHISRVDTSFLNTVNVYPNPLRLHADAALNITGKDISRIQIYGIDGSMVCTFGKNPSLFRPIKKGFQWLPGNRTVPGIYRIYTENPDAVTGNKIKKLSKVLILP